MEQVKMNVWQMEGCAITVELEADNINDYAKDFLHIFNNVRESNELLRVKNYPRSNDVTVYCEPEYKDAAMKYLKSFGKIKGCEKVLMMAMEEPYYDLDEYDDIVAIPSFT